MTDANSHMRRSQIELFSRRRPSAITRWNTAAIPIPRLGWPRQSEELAKSGSSALPDSPAYYLPHDTDEIPPQETMGLDPARVVVIEDSHIGLTAAKTAGMNCLVRHPLRHRPTNGPDRRVTPRRRVLEVSHEAAGHARA